MSSPPTSGEPGHPSPTCPSHTRAADRRRWCSGVRLSVLALLLVGGTALVIIAGPAVAAPGPESAQASSTTTTTPIGASAVTQEGSKTNSIGLAVGGVTIAIIAGGAAILYLTHRRKT